MREIEMLGLREDILQAVTEMGFEEPTPVQKEVVPVLLEKSTDLIALAQTGTGKTAAFGLPVVQLTAVEERRIQSLVLCPTRELCLQVARNLEEYSKHTRGLHVVAVYGGADIRGQIKQLERGAHVVVATPGRLNDLIRRDKIDVSSVDRVVLDEADEMLNMGFKEELNEILAYTPHTRNTILFSATMPKEAERIASTYMEDPVKITVGRKNSGSENVRHIYYSVRPDNKYAALKRIADFSPEVYGIIFCRTRMETRDVAARLVKDGYNADALHGDLSQAQRDVVMNRFRNRNIQFLVATDVAARGLDVSDLTCVINYNIPEDVENYTHRSGRTGRAGRQGLSISLVSGRELGRVRQIERIIGRKFEKGLIPSGKEVCRKQMLHYTETLAEQSGIHEELAEVLPEAIAKFEDLSKEELIGRLLAANFNELFEYYEKASDLNEKERKVRERDRNDRDNKRRGRSNFARFHINLGQSQGLTPVKVIDLVNRVSPKMQIEIGKIEVNRKATRFDADREFAEHLVEALNGYRFLNHTVLAECAGEVADEGRSERFRGGNKRSGGGRRDGNRRDNRSYDRRRGNGYKK
ncbi:MAG: DEAD/DEAH box helicase [Cytophagales bacterium]|nr:DEAD/DEAH box helicase [Cytophagales bacterium]